MTHIEITGYAVGPIWWPVDLECWKSFRYDLTREDGRFSEPGTLRDHVLHLLMEEGGDFQHCVLAAAELTITSRKLGRTRSRTWPLSCFPSVKDCLHEDPDWLPDYSDE